MDETTLNDLLECSVCLERLDTTSKVLPCQHTFCRKCLDVIVHSHKELRCPECRVLVKMKIDDLPPNVLLMRILEGMKNSAASIQNKSINPSEPQSQDRKLTPIPATKLISTKSTTKIGRTTTNPPITVQNKSNPPAIIPAANQPHAIALHDFQSKVSSDLSFKKDDLILLRNRIDPNWYIGETVAGKRGTFPINYVQIVVPLPVPQCRALYDFRMMPTEDEGCLTFKKGAVINVFRRVDQNWAEGRLGDCIGIFPIAFVQMNGFAKQLMDVSLKYNSYSLSTPRPMPIIPEPSGPMDGLVEAGTSNVDVTKKSNSPPTLPANYVALYPYKPQKSDELELKKGTVYHVTERCQDGWFKGSNRTNGTQGVFPGNYVTVYIPPKIKNQSKQPGNESEQQSGQVTVVPDLPPRNTATPQWIKPITQHVDSIFNRRSSEIGVAEPESASSSRLKSIVPTTTNKKDQIIKRMIKRSKSPTNQSDKSVVTATNIVKRSNHLSHPVHVRSGSCPSQLLQTLPGVGDLGIGTVTGGSPSKGPVTTKPMDSQTMKFLSQRWKALKERQPLHGLHSVVDTVDGKETTGSSNHHRKSLSLDATTILSQSPVSQPKTYPTNERYRCIVPYPPNGEYELELNTDDIVFVHKKRDNGWYKGTHSRTGKTGLFPASFVEAVV